MPEWWNKDMPLVQPEGARAALAELVTPEAPLSLLAKRPRAEGSSAPNDSEPRQHTRAEQQVKGWFLGFAALQKKRHGWSKLRTLRAAKDLAPELSGHVGTDVPRRWKHSSDGAPEAKCGRAPSWSDAQLTVLSEN